MSLAVSRARSQLSPSQQYEALANWVLNRRLWTLSLYTGVPVIASTTLLAMFTGNLFSLIALLSISVFSFLMCAGFILPLALLRRWDIQATSNPPTTRYALIMSIAKSSRAYRTVVMTSLSFAAFALLNSLCANALGASNWALFVPTKRHASNLNEQVLFLMLGNAVLGALLALEGLLRERTRVSWDNKINLWSHALYTTATQLYSAWDSVLWAILVPLGFALGYQLFRKSVYINLMRLPILGAFFKPFIFHSARPSTSLSIWGYLIWRLLALGIVSALHYEHIQAWFDSISRVGMLLSGDSVDPDACLRSGMESSNEYYQHFAYLELAHIARKTSERRGAIFNDPQKWSTVSRACFKVLGEDYGLLKRRGKPAPPPAVAPPSAPAILGPKQPPTTPRKSAVTDLGASIYRPLPPPSPGSLLMKSLLSASSTSPAISSSVSNGSPAGAPGSPGSDGLRSPVKGGQMPTVFITKPQAEAPNTPAPPPAEVSSGEGVIPLVKRWIRTGLGKLMAGVPSVRTSDEPFVVVPGWVKGLGEWLEEERYEWQAMGVLRRRDLDRMCIQALTGFTTASLKEDAYGTLQQDIPRVLEVLTKQLIALEEYTAELTAGADEGKKDVWDVTRAQDHVLAPLEADINHCLQEIISVFGDRLNVFRLPLPVARRLQVIADGM